MARIVEKLPFHRRKAPPMEPESAAARAETSRTLGELLKRVGDTTEQQNDDGGGNDLQAQDYTIEVEGLAARSPQQPPFVLSFSGLEYSVNKPRRLRFAGWLRRRLGGSAAGAGESGATALEQTPGNSGEKKILLDSISGEAKEGEILAVLGASGSGKSTLIDALANRIRRKSLGGSITLNGETLESRQLKVISAYVMQDDLLFPMLTVEETLMYAAEFRLPRSLSKSKKKARVKDLINQLGLSAAANTVIGDEGHRGISGGERRRVSIGADIIHDPILLFLDEPTSGLDSTSAFTVVKVLKRIAQNGSIVIMSVHQPSSRIVGLLDSLIFLSRGQAIYNGSPEGLPRFFSKFGHPIPDSENRCEFALDLVRELEASPSGTKDLVDFNRRWQVENGSSPGFQRGEGSAQFQPSLSFKDTISASISRGKLVSSAHREPIVGKNAMSTFANPFWVEMWVLSHRSFVNSRRMPELFCIRLGAVVVTGFILATIFWKLDPSPKGAQERLGFFAFAMSTTFYTCADALPVFLHERYVFMRETAYNAYRRSSYVLSNVFVSFPSLVLLSLTFAAITFFPVGLAGGFKGFVFYFLVILASFWAGNSFVTFLSGVVSHIMLGFTIVVAILAYFLLFSGFFIARQRIPLYWRWFHYMSLVKYPYEAVMLNEFDDHSLCFVRGEQIFDNSPLSNLSLETKEILLAGMSRVMGVNISSSTCVSTGPDILRQQGVTDLTKWQCIWITVAWGILFRLLFYVALLLGSKNKRK